MSVQLSLDNFFRQIDAEKKTKYVNGIVDFSSKLKLLIVAVDKKEQTEIKLLLHSLKPLSQYLTLNNLYNNLLLLEKDDKKMDISILNKIKTESQEIEDYLNSI